MSPWVIPAVYAIGFVIAHRIAARNWYAKFGVEFEGFCWACFGAALWPLIGPLWVAYKLVDSRKAVRR